MIAVEFAFLLLATVAAVGWALRGDKAQQRSAVIVALVYAACNAARVVAGASAAIRIAGACDAAAAIAFTVVWLSTGRVWPLLLMALSMVEVVNGLDYATSPHHQANWRAYLFIEFWSYVLELFILAVGPYGHALVDLLRHLPRRSGLRHWRLGHVRKAAP